jgi:23S rRNA 5-hydroxycytidine C2501 synthase
MNRIELLSPAKDLETGMAAINCGADAVYLGATRFGAREAAGNSIQDIEHLIQYAHKYWAKVYVTLNTLLYDAELEEAERLVHQVYQAGADALIIQDLGLLELNLPPLPLFASTQMHSHSPERVAFLEQVGFQRAILARELDLDQIREIRGQTSLELETFIHGALCVSYSGQCYLSYAIGGRSGNRGQCAQPCRRGYDLLGFDGSILARNRYMLSLSDLNLSQELDDLVEMGISSFKIEGRLKDKAYVMNTVGHYRRLLDAILEKRALRSLASGVVNLDFEPDPNKTFNRGYTTYFLHGRGTFLTSNDTPKSLGEPLGKILSTNRISFCVDPSTPPLHAGDGLCFLDSNKELTGTSVNRVEGFSVFPTSMQGLAPGVLIYRNLDHVFHEQLRKSKAERKIRVQFAFRMDAVGLSLTAVDEDNNQASCSMSINLSPAQQIDQARSTMDRQVRKLGETEFECAGVQIEMPFIPFVPVSVLNTLRRDVIGKLVQIRQQNYPRLTGSRLQNDVPFPEKDLTFEGNVLNQKAESFYRRHGVESIEPAAESGLDMSGRKVMKTRYCIRYQLRACPKQRPTQKLPEPLRLVDSQGIEYPLRFNCRDCVMEVYFRSTKGV